jgi:di/tripeptidase
MLKQIIEKTIKKMKRKCFDANWTEVKNQINSLGMKLYDYMYFLAKCKDQNDVQHYIISILDELGYDYVADTYGNIIVHRNKTSDLMYVAHTDSIHPTKEDKLLRFDMEELKLSGVECEVAGDDRCGVATCLCLMQDGYNVGFFMDEETGCLGSNAFTEEKIYDEFRLFVGIDRKGTGHIAYGDYSFAIWAAELCGWETVKGMTTDAFTLSKAKGTFGINVESGYYSPHTKSDFIILSELNDAYQVCLKIGKSIASYERKSISAPY